MFRFVVLMVLIAVVASGHLDSESVKGRLERAATTTTTTKKPTLFPCKEQNFKTLETCCKEPAMSFFNRTMMLACNKKVVNDLYFSVATSYIVNKIQEVKLNNTLDFSTAASLTNLAPIACFATCLFKNQTLLLPDGAIDYTATTTYFETVVGATYKTAVGTAITACKDVVNEVTVKSVAVPKSKPTVTCDLLPGLLMQCVREALLRACPTAAMRSTAPCTKQLENLKTCDVLTTTTAAP